MFKVNKKAIQYLSSYYQTLNISEVKMLNICCKCLGVEHDKDDLQTDQRLCVQRYLWHHSASALLLDQLGL